MLQKSLTDKTVILAHYAGLVRLVGGLVADPGVPGGDHAGLGLVVRGVPDLCLEEQLDAPVVVRPAQDASDRPLDVPPG